MRARTELLRYASILLLFPFVVSYQKLCGDQDYFKRGNYSCELGLSSIHLSAQSGMLL